MYGANQASLKQEITMRLLSPMYGANIESIFFI